MPFHPRWSRHTERSGYEGFYVGDDRYGHVGHQQDRGAQGQENQTVQNAKPDHPISQGAAAAPGHRHEWEALKDGPSADQSEGSQGRKGPRSKSSADGKAKPDAKKSPEVVAAEQERVTKTKAETKTEAGTSSRWPSNWTVRFPKPGHLVSLASGWERPSKTTTPRAAPTPHWCPPGLMPSQRRRIQWMGL
jgi:hypothetical protein